MDNGSWEEKDEDRTPGAARCICGGSVDGVSLRKSGIYTWNIFLVGR